MISQPLDSLSQDLTCPTEHNPTDSVSCFAWVRNNQLKGFACSSWDSSINIYRVDDQFTPHTLKYATSILTDDPCLSVEWQSETILIGGCIDNTVKVFTVGGTLTSYGSKNGHQDAVKSVHWIDIYGVALSFSYDKTMKIWDFRTQEPVQSHQLGGKPYCVDVQFPYVALGLNDGRIAITSITDILNTRAFNCSYIPAPFYDVEQITDISLFTQGDRFGFGVSSNFGRGSIYDLEQDLNRSILGNRLLNFKAHKYDRPSHTYGIQQIMYPMNAIGMHPTSTSLFTAGGDGNLFFWNYTQKQKCTTLNFSGTPVTKAKFSPDGTMVAYATGYDYAKGIEGIQSHKTSIGVHFVKPQDLAKPTP